MTEEDCDWFQGVVELLWKIVPVVVAMVLIEIAYLVVSRICFDFWWGVTYTVGCFK